MFASISMEGDAPGSTASSYVCLYCGSAHARLVCPVLQASNKKSNNYLSTPVNVSCLSFELSQHPDIQFTDYLLSSLSNGFDPVVTSSLAHNLICPNLQHQKRDRRQFHDRPIRSSPFYCFSHQPYRRNHAKILWKKAPNLRSLVTTRFFFPEHQ